jgi:hypothetical protein
MDHTYEGLKKMTVAQLREIAKDTDHEAVKGYTQLNKEHLLKALCTAFKIDMRTHHQAVGIDKTAIKSKIKELKNKRDAAITEHNHKELKLVRHKIHRLKRKLHKATA